MDKIIAMDKEVDDIIAMMKKKKTKSSFHYVIPGQDTWNYVQGFSLKRESSSRKEFDGEPTVIV